MGRMKVAKDGASTPNKKPWLAPAWKPGQTGNPGGRPMGSRQKLTEKFVDDLSKYYEIEGATLIKRVGDEQPAMLLQVIARLLPKDISLNVTADFGADISADQRRRIAENWLLSQEDDPRTAALEGEAVRINEPLAALPDCSQEDNAFVVPEREVETTVVDQDEATFEKSKARKRKPRATISIR